MLDPLLEEDVEPDAVLELPPLAGGLELVEVLEPPALLEPEAAVEESDAAGAELAASDFLVEASTPALRLSVR